MDVFCAVTNDDEANIMSCMQAKRLGVRQVMALVKRFAYVDLIDGSEIDIAVSPQRITVGSILAHVRKGDIAKVYSLPGNSAEVLEIIAHGDDLGPLTKCLIKTSWVYLGPIFLFLLSEHTYWLLMKRETSFIIIG